MIKKNARKNKYFSLGEASEISSYSQEYLSLRARQKKLRALKIGRKWMTTREWLNEYLKNAEIFKKEKITDYFSLKEAAKYSNYSSDYLRLRIGQRKLKARKFGRNWGTTKEWLDEYLEQVKNYETKFKHGIEYPSTLSSRLQTVVFHSGNIVNLLLGRLFKKYFLNSSVINWCRRIFAEIIHVFQFPLSFFGQTLESLAAGLKIVAIKFQLRFKVLDEELRIWQNIPNLAMNSLKYFRGFLLALLFLGISFSLAQLNFSEKLYNGLAILGETIVQAPQFIEKVPNLSMNFSLAAKNIFNDFRSSAATLIRGGREIILVTKKPAGELSWQIRHSSFFLFVCFRQAHAVILQQAMRQPANIFFFVQSLPDKITDLSTDLNGIRNYSFIAIVNLKTNLQKNLTELPATLSDFYASIDTKNEKFKIKLIEFVNDFRISLIQGARQFVMNLIKLRLALADFPSLVYDRYFILSYQTGDKLANFQLAVSKDFNLVLDKIDFWGGQIRKFPWLSPLKILSSYHQLAKQINSFLEPYIAVRQPASSLSRLLFLPSFESPKIFLSSDNITELAKLRRELEQLKRVCFSPEESERKPFNELEPSKKSDNLLSCCHACCFCETKKEDF